MVAAKKQTKKDLEDKIAELEVKLNKLSIQLESKSVEKPAEVRTKAPKPAERLVATSKPQGTLPKGMDTKPAEVPKPAETISQHPVTIQEVLENAYMTAPMTDFHQYRAKVTGYSPAPNRYFVRMTASVGKVSTTNWNDQKVKVTGYTAASNQYFATRARRAYHPAEKRFGTFSGVNMSVDGIEAQAQIPTPEPAKPKRGTLPKGF